MIGKFCVIFMDVGLGGEWDDRFGIGNFVFYLFIKQYFKFVKEEQVKVRFCFKKVIFIFLDKLEKIVVYIFV